MGLDDAGLNDQIGAMDDDASLEDMLDILNNFDLAEEMTEVLKKDPDLATDYKSLIGYFEKNFYKPPVNIHGYEIASIKMGEIVIEK